MVALDGGAESRVGAAEVTGRTESAGVRVDGALRGGNTERGRRQQCQMGVAWVGAVRCVVMRNNGKRELGRVVASAAAVVLTMCAGAMGRVSAEPEGAPMLPGGRPVRAAAVDAGQAPGAEETLAAFGQVRRWVGAGKVEGAGAGAFAGVCVELRLGAEVVGRGVAMAQLDGDGAGQTLVKATTAALAHAARTLKLEGGERTAERLAGMARTFKVSVELAGAPTPFDPATGLDIDAAVSPGLEGVALVREGAIEGVFPAKMMTSHQRASEAAQGLAAGLTNAADALLEPQQLRSQRGVRYLRFRVSHAAQGGPDLQPLLLHRGGRVIGMQGVDSQGELVEMAQGAARSLVRQLREQKGTPLATTALAGLAAARWTRLHERIGQAQPVTLSELRGELISRAAMSRPEVLSDPAVAGVVRVALEELGMKGVEEKALAARAEVIKRCDGTLAQVMNADAAGLDRLGASRACAALWAVSETSPDAKVREAAQGKLREIAGRTAPEQLVSSMPWMAWGVAGLEQHPTTPLREMRALLWQHQLQTADASSTDPDLVGGIVFTRSKNPLPSWQACRGLIGAAVMLSDERATPATEIPGELARLLNGVRFIRQLQVDDSAAWRGVEQAAERGGIRAATWETEPSLEATAMGLLAVSQTVESLDALSRKSGQRSPR